MAGEYFRMLHNFEASLQFSDIFYLKISTVWEDTCFFHKQHQAEIGEKIKQKPSNTLRLNFCYFKIIRFLRPCYHPKLI